MYDSLKITPKTRGYPIIFNYTNFHLYHYAGNNPIRYIDPNGEADFWNFLYDSMSDQCGSEYADYVFENDESIQFGMLVDAAGRGDPQAKQQLKQAAYLATKEELKEISDKCSYASLFFCAIGCPEVAAITSAISIAADGLLVLDELFIEKNYGKGVIDGIFLVTSFFISKKVENQIKKVAGVSIKVGKNGHFYEIGKGPIKTAEGLRKVVQKDIADGVFGKVAPEIASQIIDNAVEAFNTLLEEKQIEEEK